MLHLNDLSAIHFLIEVKDSIFRQYLPHIQHSQIQTIKYGIMNRSNEIYALINTLELAGIRREALKCMIVIMESVSFLKS